MSRSVITELGGGSPAVTTDREWVDMVDRYHHTALDILDAHRGSGGRCGNCGQHWPCHAACAAAAALEL